MNSVLMVHVKPELNVHASKCEHERMVQSQDLRTEFASRLKKALSEMGIPEWGAGARLSEITGKTAKAASKWLNAETMPGRENMKAIASALKVRIEWLQYGEGSMLSVGDPPASPSTGQSPSSDDYALIPQYSAQGHCGEGLLNDHVEVNGGLAFKRDWLRRMGAKPQHLFVIYASGSSMEPFIFDGDVVLFDSSDTEPRDRQVYAIRRPDGGVSIKRMAQQISGSWLIRSDNPDKARYPDEEVSAASMAEVPIMGRVIWRGGAMA